MGWWSESIMGGDSPLDSLGFIADEINVKFMYDETDDEKDFLLYNFSRKVIEKNLNKIIKYIEKRTYLQNISYQVLGVLILYYGVKVSKKIRDKIIDEALIDEWLVGNMNNEDRKLAIYELRDALLNHKAGIRTELKK